MNKHTPTPWNLEGRAVYSQTEGEDICIVDSGNRKVDVANAAHIVRCVNSHDALVNALTMVRDADNDCIADGLPTMPRSARRTIDAALAAAGAPQ